MTRFPIVVVLMGAGLLAYSARANEPRSAVDNAAPRKTGPSRTTVAAHGALLIDGKPVFPIGFTMPPPPDGRTPWGRGALDELADAGATVLRTGPMAEPWSDAVIQREQLYLDHAARAGLYCIPHLREYASLSENDPKEALLRALVNRFKDHPAVALWKGVDEPQWGKHAVEPMARARAIVRSLDPNHPILIIQAPRGAPEQLRPYNPVSDITGADVYPVSYPPGTHSNLPNKHLSMVGDFTKKMVDVAAADPPADGAAARPVWMVLQISFSGTIKPGKTLRMPTFPETRYMTYQAIINGARGLFYFGGHIAKTLNERDQPFGWNWTHWQKVLRPVIEEIGSKSPLYPALTAPDGKRPIKCSDPKVELVAREAGGFLYLLAAKREGDDAADTGPATFTGLPPELGRGEVLYESPRTVEAKAGAMTDWFAPYDVHVYRFERPRAAR